MTYLGPAPVPVEPRDVRPRRFWYAVAAVVAVLGVGCGVTLFALAFGALRSVPGSLPAIGEPFDNEVPATAHLTAEDPWGIFVESPDGTTSPASAECVARAVDGGSVGLTRTTQTFLTTGRGGTSWLLLYEFQVSQDGQYEFTCTLADPGTPRRFAVGENPDIGGLVAATFGGVGAIFGGVASVLGGLLIAGVIVLITALRRSSYRNRMRQGYP